MDFKFWYCRRTCVFGIVISLGLFLCFFIMYFTSIKSGEKIFNYSLEHPSLQIKHYNYSPLSLKSGLQQTWKTGESGVEFNYYRIFQTPNVPQDDPAILSYLKYFHLTPPPEKLQFIPRSVEHKQYALGRAILSIFKDKFNGFFIEAGANDGEFQSNTLHLEVELKWTGLLIEPNPFMLTKLRLLGRNAWIADVGLALKGFPEKVRFMHPTFKESWGQGLGIIEHNKDNLPPPGTNRKPKDYVYAGSVECFPLFSLLSAMNTTIVDYLSLDVEGIELKVLKAIPFEKLIIKVISLEWYIVPGGLYSLREFLITKGYQQILATDVELIVVHKDYFNEINLKIDTTGLEVLRQQNNETQLINEDNVVQ